MGARYYLCPIVGVGRPEGAEGPDDPGDPYRAKIIDLLEGAPPDPPVSSSAAIPSDDEGHPAADWALVVVSAPAEVHALLAADPEIDAFPAVSLTRRLAALPVGQRRQFQSLAAGIGAAAGDAGDVREVLARVGRELDPDFDLDDLAVR